MSDVTIHGGPDGAVKKGYDQEMDITNLPNNLPKLARLKSNIQMR